MGKKRIWLEGRLVRCPCCQNEYETDDHMPFSPDEYALHNAAKDLLAACKVALRRLEQLDSEYDADVLGPCPGQTALRAAIRKATNT